MTSARLSRAIERDCLKFIFIQSAGLENPQNANSLRGKGFGAAGEWCLLVLCSAGSMGFLGVFVR